jgi:hypothetical protein
MGQSVPHPDLAAEPGGLFAQPEPVPIRPADPVIPPPSIDRTD